MDNSEIQLRHIFRGHVGKDGLLVTLDIRMIVVISFGHQLANSCGHGADK